MPWGRWLTDLFVDHDIQLGALKARSEASGWSFAKQADNLSEQIAGIQNIATMGQYGLPGFSSSFPGNGTVSPPIYIPPTFAYQAWLDYGISCDWQCHIDRPTEAAVDIPTPMNTPVTTPVAGVWTTGFTSAGGNNGTVTMSDGRKVSFMHLNSYVAANGATVSQGQHVANSGNTGTSTDGPHVHTWGTNPNGSRFDWLPLISGGTTIPGTIVPGEPQNILSPATYTFSPPNFDSRRCMVILNFIVNKTGGGANLGASVPVMKLNGQLFSNWGMNNRRPGPNFNTAWMSVMGTVAIDPGQAVTVEYGMRQGAYPGIDVTFSDTVLWTAHYGSAS